MAAKTAANKSKMNKDESISQEQFFKYITSVAKGIQALETKYKGKKYNGLIYSVDKTIKNRISEKADFLKVYIEDKKNISPIQEIKNSSVELDNYIKKNFKVSISNHWCKMNKINKIPKPPNYHVWAHNINSILFVILNKLQLDFNIIFDADTMDYVNIFIDKDIDIEKAIFNSAKSNSFNEKPNNNSMKMKKQELEDDDDSNEED